MAKSLYDRLDDDDSLSDKDKRDIYFSNGGQSSNPWDFPSDY